MFENGSLLRRRKRFKLMKTDKDRLENELAALANINRFMFAPPQPAVQDAAAAVAPQLGHQNPAAARPVTGTTVASSQIQRPKRSFTIESLISPDKPSVETEDELTTTAVTTTPPVALLYNPVAVAAPTPCYSGLVHPPSAFVHPSLIMGMVHPHPGFYPQHPLAAEHPGTGVSNVFRFSPTLRSV
jgi:forkhead box protein